MFTRSMQTDELQAPVVGARAALVAAQTVTPEGLRARADMVCDGKDDGGSTATHLRLAADAIEALTRHSTWQAWTFFLPLMQQAVLASAIRGCDGLAKGHKAKRVCRFYRRVVLNSAFDGRGLTDPFEPGGGDFTGPVGEVTHYKDGLHIGYFYDLNDKPYSVTGPMALYDCRCELLAMVATDFLRSRDDLHQHYYEHMMHAFEVVGYKHPDPAIRDFFLALYVRMVRAKHCYPESELQMDERLGDDPVGWRKHSDIGGSCSR